MKWPVSKSEVQLIQEDIADVASSRGELELDDLRSYCKKPMQRAIWKCRTAGLEHHPFDVSTLYSPRTWRDKLDMGNADGTSTKESKPTRKTDTKASQGRRGSEDSRSTANSKGRASGGRPSQDSGVKHVREEEEEESSNSGES
eukprot:gnl/MRDRNA2_/MRDRNA2_69881_c0_seq2.p1 gnl/MRDRNA2_/MRDRNA2_69881_c0~~gnl/MRDRNA2_/MRDRNA2_69881_c0_seq2.p1  ORF type:complete len:144 (+),score=24.22 gnl/MRDRNA2_/MRDRNA2_69881_c0_seq2:103-534(+)